MLTVTPDEPRAGAPPIVYVHGGDFVGGSSQAIVLTAVYAASTTGRIGQSVDYTFAPHAQWRGLLHEVSRAWLAIVAGTQVVPSLMGDSPGGCIALATTLSLRESGLLLLAALVLLSPVTDQAAAGDTNTTLAHVGYLERRVLEPAARAYADEADWTSPLVSPSHADYTAGFPPVLTQVGTRELLMNDAVRLHRALRAAGRSSRLELYDGMPHDFQPMLAETPEEQATGTEMVVFWSDHLA